MGNYTNSSNPFEFMGAFGIHLMAYIQDMASAFLESEYARDVKQKFVDTFGHTGNDPIDKTNPQPCSCYDVKYGNADPKCPICGGSGAVKKWAERTIRAFGVPMKPQALHGASQTYARPGQFIRREIIFIFAAHEDVHNGDLIIDTEIEKDRIDGTVIPDVKLWPYAQYHLNELNGCCAIDSSGNGRDLAYQNLEDADWVSGKLNNALNFPEGNKYVNCGNVVSFERTDEFSVECWFNRANLNAEVVLASKMDSLPRGWKLSSDVQGRLLFTLQNSASNKIVVRTSDTFSAGSWFHVIVTYDGSSVASGVHIHIGGTDRTLTVVTDALTDTILNGGNLELASWGGGNDMFVGVIDEVLVYDAILIDEAIAYRYNSGSGREDLNFQRDLNPYAQWHLNEVSGTNVVDSSGNGRNATAVNIEDADWIAAKLNNGLLLDGSDEYADAGDIANFERTQPMSFEAWIKTSRLDYQYIFNRSGKPSGQVKGFSFNLRDTGAIQFSLLDNNSSRLIVYTTGINVADGGWHHIIATYDGSSSASGVKIYVDNVPASLFVQTNTLSGSILISKNLQIGRDDDLVAPTGYFQGTLDELVIYDMELTAADVAYRWNGGSGRESIGQDLNPLVHYHLNESTGFIASDSSGNGFDGIWTDTERPDWISGKLNGCVRLDGIEYFSLPNVAAFDYDDKFSLEAWFYKEASNEGIIASKMDSIPRGWNLYVGSDSKIYFQLSYDGISDQVLVRSPSAVSINMWNHIMVTYSGNGKASGVKMWINGSLVTTETVYDGLTQSIQNTGEFELGSRSGGVSMFLGKIDEFVVYERQLNATKVAFRYNSGSGTEDTSRASSFSLKKKREVEYRLQDVRPVMADEGGEILFWKCRGIRQEHDQSTDRRSEV